jgi:tRNA-dihydrouridine synthase A
MLIVLPSSLGRYTELNLNTGCPSERVAGAGCFGAQLMLDPYRVAACTSAMAEASNLPVTVKCRIGVDDFDSYDWLCNFISVVSELSPVRHFIIHARKAILKGLSPAQNRTIPPLKREYALALARDFPHLRFTINGVFKGCHDAAAAYAEAQQLGLHNIEGIMVGRAACDRPWQALADADRAVYGVENPCKSRRHVSGTIFLGVRDYAVAKGFPAPFIFTPLPSSAIYLRSGSFVSLLGIPSFSECCSLVLQTRLLFLNAS